MYLCGIHWIHMVVGCIILHIIPYHLPIINPSSMKASPDQGRAEWKRNFFGTERLTKTALKWVSIFIIDNSRMGSRIKWPTQKQKKTQLLANFSKLFPHIEGGLYQWKRQNLSFCLDKSPRFLIKKKLDLTDDMQYNENFWKFPFPTLGQSQCTLYTSSLCK